MRYTFVEENNDGNLNDTIQNSKPVQNDCESLVITSRSQIRSKCDPTGISIIEQYSDETGRHIKFCIIAKYNYAHYDVNSVCLKCRP